MPVELLSSDSMDDQIWYSCMERSVRNDSANAAGMCECVYTVGTIKINAVAWNVPR